MQYLTLKPETVALLRSEIYSLVAHGDLPLVEATDLGNLDRALSEADKIIIEFA